MCTKYEHTHRLARHYQRAHECPLSESLMGPPQRSCGACEPHVWKGGGEKSRRGIMNRLAGQLSTFVTSIRSWASERRNVTERQLIRGQRRSIDARSRAREKRGKRDGWDAIAEVRSYARRASLVKAAVPTRHARFRRSLSQVAQVAIYASSSRTYIFHLCHREYSIQSVNLFSWRRRSFRSSYDLGNFPDLLKFIFEI